MNKIRMMLAASLFAGMMFVLGGCGLERTTYLYQNSEKYVAGDRDISDRIDAVDIDYFAGDVSLVASDTGVVSVRETAKVELDDAKKVHTWVDGSTLRVRYCASGKHMDLNNLGKDLVITMPKNVDLRSLESKMSAGDLTITDITAVDAKLHSSAGDITAALDSQECDIKASAGSVALKSAKESGNINIDVSAGNIAVDAASARYLKLHASSGDVEVRANSLHDLISDTSSGDGEYYFKSAPAAASIHSSSGSVKVFLPKEPDITADIRTSAGKLFYDIPFVQKDGNYVSGSGQNKLDIDVSAGNIEIRDIDAQ